jgi:hypothetical protein
MKAHLTLILFCLSLMASAQDYQLFNTGSKKSFITDDTLTSTYNLAFDSVTYLGETVFFHPYKDLNKEQYVDDTICQHWGDCILKNKGRWIGDSIVQSGKVYDFENKWGNHATFDFNIALNESSVFFEDVTQRFSMTREVNDIIDFHGYVDSVKRYSITHTDLEGNPKDSPLNNREIVVGKNLGLISFFRIDIFPLIGVPLHLNGNIAPDAGFYQLTNKEIYDYFPGDVIQYKDYHSSPQYSLYSRSYIKDEFLQRNETTDQLNYVVRRESFDVGSSFISIDTINLSYDKSEVIATIPFDDESYSFAYGIKSLEVTDYCGLRLWTYGMYDGDYDFYPDCDIWCSVDVGGTLGWKYKRYVAGLGIYDDSFSSARPEGSSYGTEIVYFSKNGHTCGTEVISYQELKFPDAGLVIVPNPASGFFSIKGITELSDLSITDLNGKVILEPGQYKGGNVDITNLKSGVYVVALSSDKSKSFGKLVVL